MTRGAAVGAVALLLAMSLAPVLSDTADAAVAKTYDVHINKGTTWTTSFTYTASLSPTACVVVSETAITTDTTGWSAATSDGTKVYSGTSSTRYAYVSLDTSNHEADVSIKVGSENDLSDFYVGVKLSTTKPTQVAITAFHVHVNDPSLTGYTGGSFFIGQTIGAQTPTLTTGGEYAATGISYTIGTGSNGKSFSENTGLTFDGTTGKISGTVGAATNSAVTYTVTARFTTGSGYNSETTASEDVTIGTYSSASLAAGSAYAITGKTAVSIDAPSTSGITYSLQSASYTLDGGTSTAITAGTAFNGLKVNSDGSLSGTPTKAGVYVVSEGFKVNETNQTGSRTLTVTVEDQVAVSLSSGTVNTYQKVSASGTLATATHTESSAVAGTWSVDNSKFTISSAGKIAAGSSLSPGIYSVNVTYTSSASDTNSATKKLTVNVDGNLALSCSAAENTLYAATSNEYLSGDVESATVINTAKLYAGSKTVTYSITCSDLTVGTDVSIDSKTGVITLADSYDASDIGSHTVKVTCKDDALAANQATMDVTVVIVAAMVLGTPGVGTISSS